MGKYFQSSLDDTPFEEIDRIQNAVKDYIHHERFNGGTRARKHHAEMVYLLGVFGKNPETLYPQGLPPSKVEFYLKFDKITIFEAPHFLSGFCFESEEIMDCYQRFDGVSYFDISCLLDNVSEHLDKDSFDLFLKEKSIDFYKTLNDAKYKFYAAKAASREECRLISTLIVRSSPVLQSMRAIDWINWALSKNINIPWLEYAKEQFPELLKDTTESDEAITNTVKENINKSISENEDKEIATQSKAKDLIRALARLQYPKIDERYLASTIKAALDRQGELNISERAIRTYLKK